MPTIWPRWTYRATVAQTVGMRQEQQDCCLLSEPPYSHTKGMLAVLADGMGGMAGGKAYAELATGAMQQAFATMAPTASPVEELLGCYRAAEARLPELPFEENEGGATVVAVLLRDGKLSFLTIGDSRLYLLRGGGLIQLNREQTLGQVLDERAAMGLYPKEDAQNNLRRQALYAFFGAKPPKPPDRNLTPLTLRPGDRLALVSDGVFNTLPDGELCRLLAEPFAQTGESVIQAIMAARLPRQDNSSIITLLCEHAEDEGD